MSIDKWLSKEKQKKPKNDYSEDEIQEGKMKKLQDLLGKQPQKKDTKVKIEKTQENDDFLSFVIEFKDWLNKRTYIKGDLEKIETWIRNLFGRIESDSINESPQNKTNSRNSLNEQYKKIPLKFLDEKTRIALSKKLHGRKKTSSDTYYLRKLKKIIEEKLKEANYYEILKKILET